jgi:AbrB family looped-hinge helix DNA binding protein
MIKRTIGPKGQVVIPKDIREHIGLREGSRVVFDVRDKEIIIKNETDPMKFVEEFCRVPKKVRLDIKKIKKIIEEQYELH